jgi:hypothetical protein
VVRASVEASIFLLPAPLQTDPVAHPSACTLATGFLFLGVKRPGRGVNHLPDLESMLKKEKNKSSPPSLGLRGMLQGEIYFLHKR